MVVEGLWCKIVSVYTHPSMSVMSFMSDGVCLSFECLKSVSSLLIVFLVIMSLILEVSCWRTFLFFQCFVEFQILLST